VRRVWDIPGGVHPPENKAQSLQRKIVHAGIPDQLVYPLSQHIGAPAFPTVQVGDRVLKGQMIAEAKGFVSAPVHAATSGTITAIEKREIAHPSQLPAQCIVLAPDHLDEWIEHHGIENYREAAAEELLTIIHDAGIAGMGGAGFPSAVKLSPSAATPIETLILNGTECEPYITSDDILMRERATAIVRGAEIIGYIVQSKEILIGVEDNKPEAIAALLKAADNSPVTVVSFPTKYPSGGEKQLIQILTGKEVPSGGLPSSIGIVCQNLATTVAVQRAVEHGEPLISRITTVTGESVAEPGNYEVLLGTPMQHLLNLSQYAQENNNRLIMGGPMMGFSLNSLQAPVVKTTNCILAPTAQELPPPPPAQACIRCGMCAQACPASLLPQQLYWFALGKEIEKLESHHLFDCIECGACSYACPSNIPLVQYYRAAKADVREHQLDHEKSDRSKLRFDARQERLDREEDEKLARRKARKEAAEARGKAAQATPGSDATDPTKTAASDIVKAAIARTQAKRALSAAPDAKQDPAQTAIDKALAAREAPPLSDAELQAQKIEGLSKRLLNSTRKLEGLGSSPQDEKIRVALLASIELLESKIALAGDQSGEPAHSEASVPKANSAQAAIDRALAKRASAAVDSLSPRQRLEGNLVAVADRLAKLEVKLKQAQDEESDTVAVLLASVEKLHKKRSQISDELTELTD
jgi:electron transport complex protein RnfC